MAESRKERQKREAKEAYASVWKRPERKSPVTEEGERSESVGPTQLARSLNVRVTHPVFEMVRNAVRRDGFTHPEQGQFIMLPREFEAVLALENKADCDSEGVYSSPALQEYVRVFYPMEGEGRVETSLIPSMNLSHY